MTTISKTKGEPYAACIENEGRKTPDTLWYSKLAGCSRGYAGEELRREIEEYIETNMEDIDDYEKEYDRMERDGERLADHQRSVLCNIRDEVDALDALLQDTRLNRRRMQGAVRIIQQMINREL